MGDLSEGSILDMLEVTHSAPPAETVELDVPESKAIRRTCFASESYVKCIHINRGRRKGVKANRLDKSFGHQTQSQVQAERFGIPEPTIAIWVAIVVDPRRGIQSIGRRGSRVISIALGASQAKVGHDIGIAHRFGDARLPKPGVIGMVMRQT